MKDIKKNTDIDFSNAIREKYYLEKNGDLHAFLENPSPAQLRELCLLKYDEGLNKIDEVIFRNYFKIGENVDLKTTIFNYHIPKLKSIGVFLADEHKGTNINNLNLIAVLVDFNPRPFNKFAKSENVGGNKILGENNELEEENDVESREEGMKTFDKKKIKRRVVVGLLAIVGVFTASYTAKDIIFPEKKCMVWQNDHYESIDCNKEVSSFVNFVEIKHFDESEHNLKRITPNKNTVFFINNKPQVWYCKITKDSLDFFDCHGTHPLNGKQLHAITPYIVSKYIKEK